MYSRKRAQYHYAVRKAKASSKKHRAENLLAAALEGDTALLKEMKVMKKGDPPTFSIIDHFLIKKTSHHLNFSLKLNPQTV